MWRMKKLLPWPQGRTKQAVLNELKVRLFRPEEQPRYDQLIEQSHGLLLLDADESRHWLDGALTRKAALRPEAGLVAALQMAQ